ncbi:MAG: M67 family metallopeptidase [Candidatus Eisenbacteria bacterium]|uniref:M67 family metallopeptidase n=1 Tax=Eiseniibacteriota bacterium TaxID=2212470 RepID=A0A538U198_UNCEI|nr:MAG: M67 family metallopeptidase [Candidatus Eisenbacteria bacterium]
MSCVIPLSVGDEIERHLVAEHPRESCGLLVGRDQPGVRWIAYAVPADNQDEEPGKRYEISPEAFLDVEKHARSRSLDVVGFYHSHPDGVPAPSARDAATAWPHYTYLIVGVARGGSVRMAAWRLGDDGFTAETIRWSDVALGPRVFQTRDGKRT